MDNDKRLIIKIKRNASDAAANELISKYYKEMYAFVYKQTLDTELSLDLTQEIFIIVLKSIHNYDSKKAAFRTWLYKLASNRLIDYYRSKNYKEAQRVEPIEDYEFEDEYDMTISLEYREDFEKVTALVNELDPSSQQIIRLKLFGEYTFQEIALIEMIPESTVKTKYYAALKLIRKGMEVHHG
ncbi:RNA polymerase sigma factor [Neobacillus bataviensis]|nr:sigma-70 family RNA polymerase sigma factor [Neobacillus bataviensis]